MRTILIGVLGITLATLLFTYASERIDFAKLSGDDGNGAVGACDTLRGKSLYFVDRTELAIGCELAARTRVREALDEREYGEAARLIIGVMDKPDSGVEPELLATWENLPLLHFQKIEELSEAGRARDVEQEIASFQRLHPTHPLVQRLDPFADGMRLVRAERAFADGRVTDVYDELSRLSDAPGERVARRAQNVALEAVRQRARAQFEGRDFVELFRDLRTSLKLRLGNAYVNGVSAVRRDYEQRLFNRTIDTGAEDVAEVAEIDQGPAIGQSTLVIVNETGTQWAVMLRGTSDADLSVPPGRTKAVDLPSGAYVQLLVASERVSFGEMQLEGASYRQVLSDSQKFAAR